MDVDGAAGRSLFLFAGTTGADAILPAGRERFGMDGQEQKRDDDAAQQATTRDGF